MRTDLVDLLRTRTIIHPTRISIWEFSSRSDMRLEVTGFPWWFENQETGSEGRITFHLEGITDGSLDAELLCEDGYDEALEFFDVRPLSELEWANGDHWEIYCSGPLSSPLELFVELHEFLRSANCPYQPDHYLNFGFSGSFNDFREITSSNSYLLCSGPEFVSSRVCRSLEERDVSFSIVKGKNSSGGSICFRVRQSFLICQSAYADILDN